MSNPDASCSLTIGIPCRADEPSLAVTLESLLVACRHGALSSALRIEIVICINGWQGDGPCLPFTAAMEVSKREAIPLRHYDSASAHPQEAASALSITVLWAERLGKAIAWNAIRRWSVSELIAFCDADVRVSPEAISALFAVIQASPEMRIVASNEVPVVTGSDTWLRQAAALPYRFYFRNVTGRLYLMRRDALVGEMPEGLLFEDAWLTLAVGRQWIGYAPRAEVLFLPPATWRDWFAERIRTEAGKLQIRRDYPQLLSNGPAASYPWGAFVRQLRGREMPLVLLLIGVRIYTRLRARWALRDGQDQQLWRVVESSKQWQTLQ